ncbi:MULTISPECIES: hypothetical protein [Alteribacter]|uniref:Uncharacterized protein n=1 Tax=Alteribacter keqinensis TaxID=2483800 RepID=A0A3M7TVN4_9BACI|nr:MULTISPECIES: hypothetical protein [Alteribacter]MBM7094471.1 hypothetical protein [Alteribacter salitolerans]RNA69309.1 hypothetical protein EBO34_05020 [Alteribacter keqinensis]
MDIFTFPDGTQDFTYAYFAMIALFFVTWLTVFLLKRSTKKANERNEEQYKIYEMGETKPNTDEKRAGS